MVSTLAAVAINFFIALIVSTIIIYAVTKLFREQEGFGTALTAALVGTVIYTIIYFFLGHNLLTAIIAGFFWLLALMSLYKMGFWRALATAIVMWVFAIVIGFFLPTLGPF